jgi:hypothetical protein
LENTEEHCEMIWKIGMKCEMIWKICEKSKLKSEKIWKIWKIWKTCKWESEKIWKIWKISVLIIVTLLLLRPAVSHIEKNNSMSDD